MKSILTIFTFIALLFIGSCSTKPTSEIYQIKIYAVDSLNQQSMMDEYLSQAYLPALHRAGIEKVGVFKPIEGKNEDARFIMVFVAFESLSQFQELPSMLDADEEYVNAGKNYLEAAYDNAPYIRMESILLSAFSGFPEFQTPDLPSAKADRVYEYRSYWSATDRLHQRKVEMFDSGESDLFVKLGFQPMFFGSVISGAQMPNLIYMTCHENEEAQSANWKNFVDSPEWKEMSGLEKYANTVSHIDKFLLYPAEYSDL